MDMRFFRNGGNSLNKGRFFTRVLSCFIVLTLLLTGLLPTMVPTASAAAAEVTDNPTETESVALNKVSSYYYYWKKYEKSNRPGTELLIPAVEYDAASSTDDALRVETNYAGDNGQSLYTSEEGTVTWRFRVETPGAYNIRFVYYPVKGKSSAINRSMMVDGEKLFDEMSTLSFTRVWRDSVEDQSAKVEAGEPLSFPARLIFRQSNGNEIRPFQYEQPRWITTYISDSVGFYPEPYLFYFSAGEHSITFEAIKEPVIIKSFALTQKENTISYAEYLKKFTAADAPAGSSVKIQAEQMTYKSDASIYPSNDRTSSGTEHLNADGEVEMNHASKQRLNSIDGTKWKSSGQWIEYEFEAPADGFYEIILKAKQNTTSGSASSRRLLIDGEVPFEEAGNITFKYSTSWQMYTLSTTNEYRIDQQNCQPCKVYLTAGKHVLRLENALGAMGDVIRRVEEAIEELTRAYRQIHVLTGTSPELYRDYYFSENCPEALKIIHDQSINLLNIENDIIAIAGMRGDDTVVINKMRLLLEKIDEQSNRINANFSTFRDNIGAMGTWAASARSQPLSVDYILVKAPADKLPVAEYGFFSAIAFEFKAFVASFTEDYDSIGEETEDAIVVWVGNGITGGRDQANIIKQLVDNYFTPATGVNVNLRLVNMGALLPATLAGIGPDVTLQLGQGEPVNYAFRGAIVNLAQYPDFEEVAARFDESALIPYTYRNQVYALPETQSYSMMFYRKDVLEEIGVSIPNTWDEVITMIKELNKSQLYFGVTAPTTGVVGAGNGTFAMFLYQNGGAFYDRDGETCLLSNDTAIETFQYWTSLYTNYQLPVDFDFANRFRTGEMPIAVVDYSAYNLLSVSAPEIEGLWDFTMVPGTPRTDKDGNVYLDRTAVSGSTGSVIMSHAKDDGQDLECWEFLKWWTSTDIQSKFGTELEALLGTAARYQSANLAAIDNMPWSTAAAKKLKQQREWLTTIPEVPGGYYVPRQLDFAWRSVYAKGTDPTDTLIKYVLEINREIERKRVEFKAKLDAIPKEYRYSEIKDGDN